jgi:hypothetical protein
MIVALGLRRRFFFHEVVERVFVFIFIIGGEAPLVILGTDVLAASCTGIESTSMTVTICIAVLTEIVTLRLLRRFYRRVALVIRTTSGTGIESARQTIAVFFAIVTVIVALGLSW